MEFLSTRSNPRVERMFLGPMRSIFLPLSCELVRTPARLAGRALRHRAVLLRDVSDLRRISKKHEGQVVAPVVFADGGVGLLQRDRVDAREQAVYFIAPEPEQFDLAEQVGDLVGGL